MSILTDDLFAFLVDLEQNNDREWFKANKRTLAGYYAMMEPWVRFICEGVDVEY